MPYNNNIDRISFYETFHEKKVPGSHTRNLFNNLDTLPDGKLLKISRIDPDIYSSPFMTFVRYAPEGKNTDFSQKDVRDMADRGYRLVIIHEWDFPFEGEDIDNDPRKRKKSYQRAVERLEKIAGKPQKYWEIRTRFEAQGIPVSVRMNAFEMTVFRIDDQSWE